MEEITEIIHSPSPNWKIPQRFEFKVEDNPVEEIGDYRNTTANTPTFNTENSVIDDVVLTDHPSTLTLPYIRCKPWGATNTSCPLSPIPFYGTTTASTATTRQTFDQIQDDLGTDAGLALDEATLEEMIHPGDLWCQCEYEHVTSGTTKMCVGNLTIENLQLGTYTIFVGIPSLKGPIVGRFLVSDVQQRLYSGYLSQPVSTSFGFHQGPALANLSPVPSREEILQRFREHSFSDPLRLEARKNNHEGVKKYQGHLFESALSFFQIASVYSFFTALEPSEHRSVLHNLALTYFALKKFDWALAIAKRANSISPTTRMEELIRECQER